MTPSGDQAGVFANTPLTDGVNAMICIKPSVVLTKPASVHVAVECVSVVGYDLLGA